MHKSKMHEQRIKVHEDESKTFENEKPYIYLNYAATSLKRPKEVADAVGNAISSMGNAGRSLAGRGVESGRRLYYLREKIAKFFGFSHPERVVFTSNITHALNLVIHGLLKPGDHVIATDLEHNAVLRPLYQMQSIRGVDVDFLRADATGALHLDELEGMIRSNTKLIISTHASNVTGTVVDIAKIGATAKRQGVLFCVDVAQTAGVFEIDMQAQNIDILCFTGHKSLMGPTGTGGCLIGEKVDISPLISGGTGIRSKDRIQPRQYPEHLEAGTLNIHGLAGLDSALDYIQKVGIASIRAHENTLLHRFLNGIQDIPGLRLYGDFKVEHAPIVLLNIAQISSGELADVLWEECGIEVRAGFHCAPRIHKALGTENTGAVRFSFGYFTTTEEVDTAIATLWQIARDLEGDCGTLL